MTVPVFLRALRPALPRSAHGSVTVVCLRGELDVLDAPALRACLGDIRRPVRPRSIIDLTGLDYIDCACLSVLAWHAREIGAQGGTVELAGPHGAVRRILSLTGLLTGLGSAAPEAMPAANRGRRTVIFAPARERGPAAQGMLSLDPVPVPDHCSHAVARGQAGLPQR